MTTRAGNVLWKKLEAILLIMVLLIASSVPNVVKAATTTGFQNVEDIDFSDFSNWRSGVYYYTTGIYAGNAQRICLNNYVTFTSDTFKAHITDNSFKLLVRELNASKSFLRSVTLVNGQEYEPGSSAVYLAISLYKGVGSESTVNYKVYESMFANGFVAELCTVKDTTIDTETDTEDSDERFYAKLKKALENGDTSKVDVSDCKVLSTDFYLIHWPKLKEECYVEHHSGKSIYPNITSENDYAISFQYQNMDDDYVERLGRVKDAVNTYLAMVDSEMSDLDKILLAHEYLVNLTEYKNENSISHTAGGPLGNGYGVCDGYADALTVLLHEVGIETTMVRSSAMNHAWAYVKLDGSWYHVDPTWDDTGNGTRRHKYLLRNATEFSEMNYYSWTIADCNEKSTSTKYTDWYVHDVAGTMYYHDGMWYYWDKNTNNICCSDALGKVTEVVFDGSGLGTITLKGISGNRLSYYIGSTLYYIEI